MSVNVKVEPTRNEDSVVFKLNKILIPPGTGSSFPNREIAQSNPLAKALFEVRGVASVWLIGSEVQVTKDPAFSWGAVKGKVVETIKRVA
ncbi:MAG: NifU N-terminal domain-containing protein [Nitrospinota bacterium]|nr:NifU N-terminal domain-containing protein [Nitrospinota bacterium]